ncbi:Di-copper centre-containing protein [Pterulicium gracile]|uniref:Di-copper centre-containing protein n=1 Tax=Pterulicium gracile TaxID=1884261 RepID=A0A5C3QWW3_9AGAR|nr:Di-copper centre-containing protein [Pterula gracilis]
MFVQSLLPLLSVVLLLSSGASAACTNPRVRKNWHKLTLEEKEDWTRSIACLSQKPGNPNIIPQVRPFNVPPPSPNASAYDDHVYLHMDLYPAVSFKRLLAFLSVHFNGQFLFWHRWYTFQLEEEMRNKCGYKGSMPFWKWDDDAKDVEGSEIFTDVDPITGIGGWGNPDNDWTVEEGALGAKSGFSLNYPIKHSLRRNFSNQPWIPFEGIPFWPDPHAKANETFTPEKIEALIDGFRGDFTGFQAEFEGWDKSHFAVHSVIGGDATGQCPAGSPDWCQQATHWSSNEPMFFLHHSMVDRIFWKWQNKYPENKEAFGGGTLPVMQYFNNEYMVRFATGLSPPMTRRSAMPTLNIYKTRTIQELFHIENDYLCYTYED